jgi:hypothetical protein
MDVVKIRKAFLKHFSTQWIFDEIRESFISESNVVFLLFSFAIMEHRGILDMKQKFWEELIAYFPLIQHESHRKQRLEQFFIATGTSLPSCYLATIGGYTDRHTRPTVLLLLRVFVAAGTCLRSPFLAMKIGMQKYTHRLMRRNYEVCCWDGLRCHDKHTKFNKDWLRHSKVNMEGFTDTQTAWRSHKPT